MIEIKEVKTRRQRREFLSFPDRLYKGNGCYVPPLYLDEKKIFRKDYLYYETCEAVYYNAYRDGKIVGRISGILQKASNQKTGENRIRFTRFDSIDDPEVAKALFDAVEQWGLSKGMDTVCGPLGFSDLEREGLLIEGFDQVSTFEEQYNAPYYQALIENLGYEKEVDWNESKITAPTPEQEAEMNRLAALIMERYGLRIGKARNVKDFVRRYKDGLFDILDKSYDKIYGSVPFTEGMKKLMEDNFKFIIDLDHVGVVVDENDRVVLIALCFPSLSKAVQAGSGHITPAFLREYLKTRRKPEIIDLGLIGVDPEWANRGVSVIALSVLAGMLHQPGTKWAETNLNLEHNDMIQALWRRFGREIHKRRRSFVKKIG